jgi:hypothetical protein
MRKIPSLKGFPEQIKPTIKAIERCQNLPYPSNKNCVEQHLSVELPKLSPSKRPKLENLIYAQVIPTCKRLGLITKDQRHRRLTFIGRKLSNCAKNDKEFKVTLGKAILEFDKKYFRLVEALKETQRHPGDFVNLGDLIAKLWEMGIDSCQNPVTLPKAQAEKLKELKIDSKGTRLSDGLQFYEYVGIVMIDEKKVCLLQSGINSILNYKIEKKADEIPDVKFFHVLYEKYRWLAREKFNSPFVPIIPYLREMICDELGITETTFSQKLVNFPSSFMGKRILLSPPMVVKPDHEIIRIGREVFYFISIYNSE